jgi:hypothetical protein
VAIKFMDECRVSADKFLRLWHSGDDDAILAHMHPPVPFSRLDFDKVKSQSTLVFGEVKATDYRSEILALDPGDSLQTLRSPLVEIEYAATTSKSIGSAGIFFKVVLSRLDGSCKVAGFKVHKYLAGEPGYLHAHAGE